jgi:hypothetical protein
MTRVEYLRLGAATVVFLAAGAVNAWWSLRVTTILQTRHPEVWAKLQGGLLFTRVAFGGFLRSGMHRRMNDPELSRAIRMNRITGIIVMICLLSGFAVLFSVGHALPR